MKFLVLLALSLAVVSAKVRYDGHEVLRTYPASREQVSKLEELRERYDFWTEPRLNGPTDIRASGSETFFLRNYLDLNGIKYEPLIADVERFIRWEEKSQVRSTKAMDWTSYHGVADIQSFLRDISSRNSDISEVINIGKSYQGRDMLVIRIGNNTNGRTKKAMWIDGGIHAREWIAPAVATWTINELLTNRARYTDLLNDVDIYILPSANPDGYEFSRSTDRLWRKTRQPHNSPLGCVGTDPNRNFDHHWGEAGTSTNKCSEIYTGPKPFSEPETAAMRDFINNRANADWRVYVALHSYAQMILTPWGYTYDLPSDYSDLRRLGDSAASALTAVHGTRYEVGSVTEILSPGAGGSDDWAKGSGNFKYSYTIEVRDTGRYGFLLPADQIIPTSEETFQALLVMANFVKNSN